MISNNYFTFLTFMLSNEDLLSSLINQILLESIMGSYSHIKREVLVEWLKLALIA